MSPLPAILIVNLSAKNNQNEMNSNLIVVN